MIDGFACVEVNGVVGSRFFVVAQCGGFPVEGGGHVRGSNWDQIVTGGRFERCADEVHGIAIKWIV